MEIFSSMLAEFVNNTELSLPQLALNTGIERSTLYQYLNGKRKLKSKQHFELILRQLALSAAERRELEKAWKIQLYGEEVYLQKQYLEHFFEILPVIEQTLSRAKNVDFDVAPSSSAPLGGTRGVVGSTAVEEELFAVLCGAKKDERVIVMAQPSSRYPGQMLNHPAVYRAGIQLTMIARLSRNRKEQYQNLPILEQIMHIFSVFPDCIPLCYYSETDDSRAGVMPQNIVLTEHRAVLLTDDGAYALITEEPALLEQLNRRLQSVLEYCVPIGRTFSSQVVDEISYLMELFERVDFASRFEMSGSFCTTPFLGADIIRRNINPDNPGREELAGYFTQMLTRVRTLKEEKPGTILSSVAAMTAFARTGVLQDVPKYMIPEPLPAEDRLVVLEAIHQAVADGWYHLRLFRENNLILDRRWDSMCSSTLLFIELFCADGNRYFEFTENTLLSIFMQYLQNIAETDQVTTEEETIILLEKEIARLREETRGR